MVERIEYDPNRTAHIALVQVRRRRAPLHPRAQGREGRRRRSRSGADAPIKPGNALPLRNIPVGSIVHNIEMKPGKGGAAGAQRRQLACSCTAREGIYAHLRLRSGEMRKVHVDCRATIGEVGNDEHNLRSSARPARSAGAASARRCAASR